MGLVYLPIYLHEFSVIFMVKLVDKYTVRPMDSMGYIYLAIRPVTYFHQEYQEPKVEGFLNLMGGHFGGGFSMCFPVYKPYI